MLKEPSRWDGSFEYPQHDMFWLRNKKNNFQLLTLIWGPACSGYSAMWTAFKLKSGVNNFSVMLEFYLGFFFKPYPATIFLPWKCCLLYMSAAYIQVHFRLDFFMKANSIDPDQTAPKEQSDLGPYCLQYRLPKNISRREEQWTSRGWWAKG